MVFNMKQKLKKLAAFCAAGALMATGISYQRANDNIVKAASICTIDSGTKYQNIRGFGGIDMQEWQGYKLSNAECATAFGNGDNQLGLTVLRVYVNPNSSQWSNALSVAQYASKAGATVFATPWEPPSNLAESGGNNGKLHLKKSNYGAYAKHLNDFGTYMKNNGVDLYSISVQNEPDYAKEWTYWSADETTDFIANYGNQITSTRLMSPETFQYGAWNNSRDYYNKILNNSKAMANTDVFATHFYGTPRSKMDFPTLENCGKEIWMTEVYVPNSEANSCNRFPEALQVATNIHNGLVMGNMSVYTWWYIKRSYGLLDQNTGAPTKRGYMMAQYSKFIRPGATRIGCTEITDSSLKDGSNDKNPTGVISAYKKGNQITVVVVNDSDTNYTQQFSFKNENNITNVDRYRTSANENLALTKSMETSGNGFFAQIPGRSCSTFVVTLGEGNSTEDPGSNTQPQDPEPVVTPTPAQPTNGVYFHDTFENGTDDWETRFCQTATSSSTTAYEGSKSLYASGRTKSWNGVKKSLSGFTAGQEYSFSANACFTSGSLSSDTFYMKIQYTGSDNETHYDGIAEGTAKKGEWVHLANTNYKIPSDATNIELYIETAENTSETYVDFYVDDVTAAVAGTKIEGAVSVGDIILGDLNGDGKVNVVDYLILKRVAKGKVSDTRAKLSADVNQENDVTADDAKMMLGYLTKNGVAKFANVKQTEPEIVDAPGGDSPAGGGSSSGDARNKDNPPKYMDEVASKIAGSVPNDIKSKQNGVNYGELKKITYNSQTAGRATNAYVLLPPNYNSSKKYPVLYMMHGYYENESRFVYGDNNSERLYRTILGNLEAKGEAEEMVVVFPYIYTSKERATVTGMDLQNSLAYDNFVNDLKTDLMPYIEQNFSVRTDREGRAITGFSMGGRESLFIGTTCHNLFGYVGAACPAPGLTPLNPSTHPGQIQESECKHNDLYLLLITGGTDDTVVYSNPKDYYNMYIKNGSKAIYNEIQGGGHWDNTIEPHFYNLVRFIFKG